MGSLEQLLVKSQLKNTDFRILGEELADLTLRHNTHLYEDSIFYTDLMKDYLADMDTDDTPSANKEGLWASTLKQLQLKRLRQQESRQGKTVVDRRASKCRKIRYTVHNKLVNFMSSVTNKSVLDNRD